MGKDRSIDINVARQNWVKYIAIVVRNATGERGLWLFSLEYTNKSNL